MKKLKVLSFGWYDYLVGKIKVEMILCPVIHRGNKFWNRERVIRAAGEFQHNNK